MTRTVPSTPIALLLAAASLFTACPLRGDRSPDTSRRTDTSSGYECCDAYCGYSAELRFLRPGGWPAGAWVFTESGGSEGHSLLVEHDGDRGTYHSGTFSVTMPDAGHEQASVSYSGDGRQLGVLDLTFEGSAPCSLNRSGISEDSYNLYDCCCGGCRCDNQFGVVVVDACEPSDGEPDRRR